MYYLKLSEIVIPIAAAVSDVISLLEQVRTSPTTWDAVTHLVNAFLLTC